MLDIILSLFLVFFLFVGYKKGFISSIISLVGLSAIVILIGRFAPLAKEGLIGRFALSPISATVLSYVLIVVLIMLIAKIIKIILHKIIIFLEMNWLDKLLGSVFGLMNGVLILMLIVITIDILPISDNIWEHTKNSKLTNSIRILTQDVENNLLNKIPQPNIDKGKVIKKIKKIV